MWTITVGIATRNCTEKYYNEQIRACINQEREPGSYWGQQTSWSRLGSQEILVVDRENQVDLPFSRFRTHCRIGMIGKWCWCSSASGTRAFCSWRNGHRSRLRRPENQSLARFSRSRFFIFILALLKSHDSVIDFEAMEDCMGSPGGGQQPCFETRPEVPLSPPARTNVICFCFPLIWANCSACCGSVRFAEFPSLLIASPALHRAIQSTFLPPIDFCLLLLGSMVASGSSSVTWFHTPALDHICPSVAPVPFFAFILTFLASNTYITSLM